MPEEIRAETSEQQLNLNIDNLHKWSDMLIGKKVTVDIGELTIKGEVKRVMLTTTFPKRMFAVVLDENNIPRVVYELDKIQFVEAES